MAADATTAVAGINLANKLVDKLDPTGILIALFLLFGILLVALLIRKTLGDKAKTTKLDDAVSSNAISAHQTSQLMHVGQGEELKSLYERLSSIEEQVDILKKDSVKMQARIFHLESALTNVSLHFKNLELCPICEKTNRVTLFSIRNLLDAAT